MKWLSIFLAIGLTASEKLDRTYLPPPGAQFSGGNPDDIQGPFELPNFSQTGSIPHDYVPNSITGTQEPLIKSPVTTTSYAFTQTTTFPSIESYATTAIPINPIIGIPVENLGLNNNLLYNQNLPINLQHGTNNVNILPGTINQHQNIVSTEGDILSLGPKFQQPIVNSGFQQYPSEQLDTEAFDHFSNSNVGHPNTVTTQKTFEPQGRYTVIQNQGVLSEGVPETFSLSDSKTPQSLYNQDSRIPSYDESPQNQVYSEVQNTLTPELPRETQFQHYGQAYSDVPSTISSSIPSVATDSTIDTNKYYERPQAASDRGALILNYENVLTPNSYSYSYDTSNGIHADESGVVGDGTKAKGSYSYTGDDGKVYSVFYTADENGFQPHGDHLPTPPPIPEAIKRVIEQAARDEAAGIIDDGSYDENKYGSQKYYTPINPHHLEGNNFVNTKKRPKFGGTKKIYNDVQPEENTSNENNLFKNGNEHQKHEKDYDEGGSEKIGSQNLNGNIIDSPIPHNISEHIYATDFKNSRPVDTSPNKNNKINQVNNSRNHELPRFGQASAFPKDNSPPSAATNEIQSPLNKNDKFVGGNLPEVNNNNQISSSDFTDNLQNINDHLSNYKITQEVDQNGYQYKPPENKKNPPRFRIESPSSTTEAKYTMLNKITTPFPVTTEIRIAPANRVQNSISKSTTPRPFMTSRVTTVPRGGTYSDYDNEYDQELDDENISNNKQSDEIIKNGVRRPIQSSQTVTPRYMSTTAIPTTTYSPRISNTNMPQTNSKTQDTEKPMSVSPEFINGFGNTKTSNYIYPSTKSSGVHTTVAPKDAFHINHDDYNPSMSAEYLPQEHLTSKLSLPIPTTTSQTYSASDNFRPSEFHSNNGYQYQPMTSGYNQKPEIPKSPGTLSNPIYYQRPIDYSGVAKQPDIGYETTSPKPSSTTIFAPKSQDSFINSGFPESHVFDTPFSGYVYEPPKIIYSTTAPKVGTTPDFAISSQFTTTIQPATHSSIQDSYNQNTAVDTFGRPIESEMQLIISSPDQKNNQFIVTQSPPTNDLKRFDGTSTGANVLSDGDQPAYREEQSTRYPEYNNQARIIGENFTGPKQPQKFDSKTGYYYK